MIDFIRVLTSIVTIIICACLLIMTAAGIVAATFHAVHGAYKHIQNRIRGTYI